MKDRNKSNDFLLVEAAAQNNHKTIDQLLKRGANLAVENKHHLKPMEIAAIHQNWDAVLEIAKYKTDEKDRFNYSNALLMAVKYKQYYVALALLQAGAKPNRQMKTGEGCLHLAVESYQPSMIELLCRFGANPAAENKHHLKPAQIAARQQNWPAVLEIVKCKNDDNDQLGYSDALLMAVKYQQFNVALRLLLAGAKPNPPLKNVESCLHVAVKTDNPGMVDLLYRFGAKSEEDDNKFTPCSLAAKLGQWQTTIPVFLAQQDFETAREALVSELNQYAQQWTSLHRKRAASLSVVCMHKAKSIKELIALLELQIDLFDPRYKIKQTENEMKKLPFHERQPSRRKDRYNAIIKRYHDELINKVFDEELVVDDKPINTLKPKGK